MFLMQIVLYNLLGHHGHKILWSSFFLVKNLIDFYVMEYLANILSNLLSYLFGCHVLGVFVFAPPCVSLVTHLCNSFKLYVSITAFFQFVFPIYSAKAVRFRTGQPKYPMDSQDEAANESAVHDFADKFVWTYTSPKFPMVQENCLQKFKFPEPAICIGGILLVELLARVQRQEMDNLYYICVTKRSKKRDQRCGVRKNRQGRIMCWW